MITSIDNKITDHIVKILDSYFDGESSCYFNMGVVLKSDLKLINDVLKDVDDKSAIIQNSIHILCDRYRTYNM